MSRMVYVRPFNPKDEKERGLLVEWLDAGRHKNRFDPEIFLREQVSILTCFNEEEILGFIPIALAMLIESLAFKPGISPRDEAKCLQAMQHHVVQRAFEKNIPDAFFVTFDETVMEFAKGYNWNEVRVPMLNLHFASLEPKGE